MALTKVTGHVVLPTTNIEFHNTKSTGIVTFTDTTQSTSTTTGGLQIAGGVGIVKNLNVGGNLNVTGNLTYTDVDNINSTGIITANSNIHLQDYIYHKGEDPLNSYFGFPDSDTIDFFTDAERRLRIQSTGRIGINTDSARVNGLHIYDKHLAVTEGYPLTWLQPNSASSRGRMTCDSGGNYLFQFGSGNDEKIRFNNGGEVGIGTNNPNANLHIWSTGPGILLTDSNQATNTRNWSISAAIPQILRIQAQNDSYAGGGNLFDFHKSTNQINEFLGMNGGNYWFSVNNNTKRVGIGTTNIQALLHLKGTGGGSSGIRFDNSHDNVNAYFHDDSNDSDFLITYGGTGGAELTIHADGNLGLNESNGDDVLIGTSSVIDNSKLTIVKGAAGLTTAIALNNGNGSGDGSKIISTKSLVLSADYDANNADSKSYLGFETDGTERLRIKSDGGMRLQKSDGNGNFTISRNASVTTTDQPIGVLDFASNTAHTVQARLMGKTRGTSNVGGDLVVETRADGGSLDERFRITGSGAVGINTTNPENHLLEIYTAASADWKFRVHTNVSDGAGFYQRANGDFEMVLRDASNNNNYIAGSGGGLQFVTSGTERLRIKSNGHTGIGTDDPLNRLHVRIQRGNSTGLTASAALDSGNNLYLPATRLENSGMSGNIEVGQLFLAGSTDQAQWLISCKKTGSNVGDFIFRTRTAATTSAERLRINKNGSLTNTTNSTHSQGAGTFNIKGVINQYSQGSGSGLIFDCDFGRLTGYSDDANVTNGTNLSGVLYHATTDWSSSSSNTPISVDGGTFQYRVSFGGYMEGISNGGRVSVAAGSGSPNMAETLNTASMTIETWCWYDGTDREVLVSRWGSGFPNQFNMICDPNGQFHYNSGGVGAGSGNISGEHFPDKTWHHHVWQYDSGSNVNRWYINGAFANSRSHGSSLAVSSSTGFGIFSRGDDYERWRGKIAIVRIYNRALSATEIKNHFELERGRFGV